MSGSSYNGNFPLPPNPSGSSVLFTPAVPGDWNPAIPPNSPIEDAINQLAARTTILEAGAVPLLVYACPMAAIVGDIVYQTAVDNTVGLADASDPTKMPVKGFIRSKPTATTCTLQDEDTFPYAGAVAGTEYFADPANPGKIVTPAPAPVVGQVGQKVATGEAAGVLDITISSEPPVYY